MTVGFKKTETLGEKLKKRREELGLNPAEVARHIQTSLRLLQALEEDKYEKFPAKVYALGFFKRLLNELVLSDQEEWLKEFNNEWDVRMFRKTKEATPLPENRGKEPYFTPTQFWTIAGISLFVVLLIFLSLRFVNFVAPPELILERPREQETVGETKIMVKGKTEKESRLTVNGRGIKIDEQGNFEEEIEVASGLNTLKFHVQNRFGKENNEVRHVLVR